MGVLDRLILSDEQWARIAPHIISDVRTRGSSGRDNRMCVEAVLWIVRTGSPWRDLPDVFGPWNSYALDRHLYKERHLIECCFSKLKQFRRVATRYEKTARNYLAVVTIAATILWLR